MRENSRSASLLLSLALTNLAMASPAVAGVVYSNNFDTPATAYNGLTPSGTLTSLSTDLLPTDSGGLSSPNQSNYLGVGYNVNKVVGTPEIVSLSLSGLVSGTSYYVAFDLFIGGSWDGSAGLAFGTVWGPDEWALKATSGANTSTLVDATFSNCGVTNQLCGATSPQTYSDATPTAGLGGTTFAPTTGADYSFDTSSTYSQDYSIYDFGHTIGDPALSFTAGASTATLNFERISGTTDSPDEYWGLDNITVSTTQSTATPEPRTSLMAAFGACFIAVLKRRCMPRTYAENNGK
jgi:hypothetical protein